MPTASTKRLHVELEALLEKYPHLSVYELVGVLELVKLEAVASLMEPQDFPEESPDDEDREGEEWKDGR